LWIICCCWIIYIFWFDSDFCFYDLSGTRWLQHVFLQATKKYDDGVSDDTSGSDFDDEEDPDKIEVPGKL